MVPKNLRRDETHEGYVMEKILVRVIDAYIYNYKEDELKFLILKRSKTKIYEHLWQGVAGKIEKGGVSVNVVEVKNPKPIDPDRNESNDANINKPLRFGSRTSITTAGNWE